MIDSTFSQLDFIASGRAWERAYFTTFALSLTFFESYLLPPLRKAGCERVTVFVDVSGYRASLMELKSRSVGQEYSLIPIQSATGIFHPKITYLWGIDGDILLVGSGNLTFGGHGRNIEVLEALNPDDDSAAFEDFADFLEKLVVADSLTIPDTKEIIELSGRARNQAGAIDSERKTQLLHSVETSIIDQIVELAALRGPWKELICLSPFHHHTGEPVRELAKRLEIATLTIGVPPSPKHGSAFPFEEGRAWDLEIKTVAPRIEGPTRPLHAKWFELRGAEHWTLTGSVNATQRSLASAENVEVAVLRVLDGLAPDNWKSTTEPKHESSVFSSFGDSSNLILHAAVTANGLIEGQLLGDAEFEGLWMIRLQVTEELAPEYQVRVESNGRFQWEPKDFDEFATANSVQISLTKGQISARGWLSVQSILKLPSRSRAAQAAISRMLARSETLDDCRALLDYIAFHSQRLVGSPTVNRKNPKKQVDDEPTNEWFSVADLSLGDHQDVTSLLRDLAEEAAGKNRSSKTLSVIARLLGGRSLGGRRSSDRQGRGEMNPEQEDNNTLVETEPTRQALDQFNAELNKVLNRTKRENRNLVPILVVWLNVNLDMCLRHLQKRSQAFRFVEQWMRIAINSPISEEVRKGLDETVFGAAAALGLQIGTNLKFADEVFKRGMSLELIHQWLETYLGKDVDSDMACERTRKWFLTETPHLLIDGQVESAIKALTKILTTPTRRIYLAEIINAQSRGIHFALPENAFRNTELKLLNEVRAASPSRPRHKLIRNQQDWCSKCYTLLLADIMSALRAHRIARCIQCNTILILLEP